MRKGQRFEEFNVVGDLFVLLDYFLYDFNCVCSCLQRSIVSNNACISNGMVPFVTCKYHIEVGLKHACTILKLEIYFSQLINGTQLGRHCNQKREIKFAAICLVSVVQGNGDVS